MTQVKKQKFRIKGRTMELFATPKGQCPLINRANQVREFAPQMAFRILGIVAHMERERGNAKNPAKITPHRLEIQGWREMTPTEIDAWAAGVETRDDMHIGSPKKGKISRQVFPDGLEVQTSPASRTSEQDAEKERLRQLLAAKDAELEALKAEQSAAKESKPVKEQEPEKQAPEPKPEEMTASEPAPTPKRRGRKRKTTTKAKSEGGEE